MYKFISDTDKLYEAHNLVTIINMGQFSLRHG